MSQAAIFITGIFSLQRQFKGARRWRALKKWLSLNRDFALSDVKIPRMFVTVVSTRCKERGRQAEKQREREREEERHWFDRSKHIKGVSLSLSPFVISCEWVLGFFFSFIVISNFQLITDVK